MACETRRLNGLLDAIAEAAVVAHVQSEQDLAWRDEALKEMAAARDEIRSTIARLTRELEEAREIIRDLVDDEDAGLVAQQDPSNALDYGPPVTVGRVVHYATPEGPLAAIVSRVRDANLVDLHVLAIYEHRPVLFLRAKSFDGSEEPAAGTWHWPPRA